MIGGGAAASARAHEPRGLEAVHAGHRDVEDDQREVLLEQACERFDARSARARACGRAERARPRSRSGSSGCRRPRGCPGRSRAPGRYRVPGHVSSAAARRFYPRSGGSVHRHLGSVTPRYGIAEECVARGHRRRLHSICPELMATIAIVRVSERGTVRWRSVRHAHGVCAHSTTGRGPARRRTRRRAPATPARSPEDRT